MTPTRVWEFLLGAFVAWRAPTRWPPVVARFGAPIAGGGLFCLVAFATFAVDAPNAFVGHPSLLTAAAAVLTAVLIAVPAPFAEARGVVVRSFARIGDASYAIYLAHFPIIVLYNYQPFGGTRLGFDGPADLAIMLAAITIASAALYLGFDRPRRLLGRWRFAVVATAALIALAVPAADAANRAGFSAAQLAIFDGVDDRAPYRCGKLFRILNPTERVCALDPPDGAERAVMLVGDSHADAIKTAFADAARRRGVATYFYVPNDPLVGAVGPEDVVSDMRRLRIDHAAVHFLNIYDDPRAAERLLRFVDRATAAGIAVDVLAPTPGADGVVPAVLFAATRAGDAPVDAQGWTSARYVAATAGFRAFAQAAERAGARIFATSDRFCGRDRCALIDDVGAPLYFDSHHLTLTGARRLTPVFERMLSPEG